MKPSTAEDCLEALHALGAAHRSVEVVEFARWLGVQPVLAGAMIEHVTGAGLVECSPPFRVRLTPRGGREAVRVVRRRRLIESVLVAHHGYPTGAAQVIAARLAYSVPDALVAEAARAYGEPDLTPRVEPAPAWALLMRGRFGVPDRSAEQTC